MKSLKFITGPIFAGLLAQDLLTIHFGFGSRVSLVMSGNSKGNRSQPTEPREPLDISGVVEEWDATDDIRERLRNEGPLLHPESGKGEDIPTCCKNASLLQPFLSRMGLHEKRPLPNIDALREAVEAIMQKAKRSLASSEIADMVKAAWRIRKLLVFLKMKCRRGEVSTVPCLQH